MSISLSNPVSGGTLNRTDSIIMSASDNIPLDASSLANITLTPAVSVLTTLDSSGSNITIVATDPNGFPANTQFTLTVPATVTDTYGEPNVAPLTATFTTGS